MGVLLLQCYDDLGEEYKGPSVLTELLLPVTSPSDSSFQSLWVDLGLHQPQPGVVGFSKWFLLSGYLLVVLLVGGTEVGTMLSS